METVFWWLIIFGNIVISIPVAFAASEKNRSPFGFFVLSFFFTFIYAMLILIAIPPRELPRPNVGSGPSKVECPNCLEQIHYGATLCRFCRSDVRDLMAEKKSEIEAFERDRTEVMRKRQAEEERAREKRRIATQRLAKVTAIAGIPIAVAIIGVSAFGAAEEANRQAKISAILATPNSVDELYKKWTGALTKCGFNATDLRKETGNFEVAGAEKISSRDGQWRILRSPGSAFEGVSFYLKIDHGVNPDSADCVSQELFLLKISNYGNQTMRLGNGFSFLNFRDYYQFVYTPES